MENTENNGKIKKENGKIEDIEKMEVEERVVDDTKLIDGIYKLKSYINIADSYIQCRVDNQDFVDLGLLIDEMGDIVEGLREEYIQYVC